MTVQAPPERWSPEWRTVLWRRLASMAFESLGVQRAVRRRLARDPMAFALMYLRHHLRGKETGEKITFSEAHIEWCRLALGLADRAPEPRGQRHAVVAPRGCGKSTWWFLIIPLWAAANGHVRFAAAFASAAAQAETHQRTLKNELDNNALLRLDFPDLCTPAKTPRGGTMADRAGMMTMANGFTFAARGVDSAVLGLKVGSMRPDFMILDDVEPDESSYSADMAVKRLSTITDAILELNIYAMVVAVGTVTMPGSIMHQLVKHANGVETADWIADQRFQARHFRAIVTGDDGIERSLWPEKWSLEFLRGIRHTRSYAKNYDNDPMARDGAYWVREDFQHGPIVHPEAGTLAPTRTALFIDPIVAANRADSDFTGLSVVSWAPEPGRAKGPGRALVRKAWGVRLTGGHLRQHVMDVLTEYPEIKLVVIEVNQGADLWPEILHDLPVKLRTGWHGASKDLRFAEALDHYQQRRVWHEKPLPAAEEQMVAFPHGPYDDVADAVSTGVLYFLGGARKIKIRERTEAYV